MLSVQLMAQHTIPDDFCISSAENDLFERINQLLEDYDQQRIDLSASLSYVARLHVDDLLNNRPDTSICNLSSWSDKGNWTPCCYNPYVLNQDCMWDKPKELTTYRYRGYELVGYFEGSYTNDTIMNLWTSSKPVLDMILTNGYYKDKQWECMGVAINSNYVSVWFGQRDDRVEKPLVCPESVVQEKQDTVARDEIQFYVIFGSYSSNRDAKEDIKKLEKEGFANSGILKSGNLFRIYIDKFSTIKEAMFFKQSLPYTYREAWIYKE